jgi:hypothetical protein
MGARSSEKWKPKVNCKNSTDGRRGGSMNLAQKIVMTTTSIVLVAGGLFGNVLCLILACSNDPLPHAWILSVPYLGSLAIVLGFYLVEEENGNRK